MRLAGATEGGVAWAGKASAMTELAAPPCQRFIVTRSGAGWSVRDGPEKHGPYLSRRDAVSDAIEAARAAASEANPTEVVDRSGKQQELVLWRSGGTPEPGT